jgi:hypothetical protein
MTTLDRIVGWLRFRHDATRWYRALWLIANDHPDPKKLAREAIRKP